MVDDGGQKIGVLLEEVFFDIGVEEAIGKVELQEFISTSDVRLTTLQNPLPYIGQITPIDIFRYGAEAEDDESLRSRILISMADKSTAGAEMTYQSYTYSSDARIKDVAVYNAIREFDRYIPNFVMKSEDEAKANLYQLFVDFATVEVVVYAPDDIDNTVIDRITDVLNDKEVRPLTDKLSIKKLLR